MKIDTYQCDRSQCKKLRSEDANHWMHGHKLDQGGFVLLPFDVQVVIGICSIDKDRERAAHLCGQECATWWVQQQIGKMATEATTKARAEQPEGHAAG